MEIPDFTFYIKILYYYTYNIGNCVPIKYFKSKVLRYEDIKDVLGIKDNSPAGSRKIKKTLFLLSAIGLIKFQTGYYINLHGGKIECFDLEEVYYYVKYNESKWSEEDCIETKEVAERLSGITKDYYDFTEA